jgi:Trk K+ transport system NAD-binding subunit
MRNELVEIEVPRGSPVAGKAVIDLGLPQDVLIVLIQRKGNIIVPKGSTRLEAEDMMLILAERPELEKVRKLVAAA